MKMQWKYSESGIRLSDNESELPSIPICTMWALQQKQQNMQKVKKAGSGSPRSYTHAAKQSWNTTILLKVKQLSVFAWSSLCGMPPNELFG